MDTFMHIHIYVYICTGGCGRKWKNERRYPLMSGDYFKVSAVKLWIIFTERLGVYFSE